MHTPFASAPAPYTAVPSVRTFTALLLALAVGALPAPKETHAQQRSGVALSVQASTMGPSIGVHMRATEALRIQIRGAYLARGIERPLDDNEVDARVNADIRVGGPEARLNWHPFTSSFSAFYVSAGALYNVTGTDARIYPTSPYKLNENKTFTVEKVGEMNVEASYSPISPYAGIGFGDALNGQWGFMVELGAYYTGSPNFSFDGEGLIKPTERNEAVLEQGFKSFRVLPHLAVGLSYQL